MIAHCCTFAEPVFSQLRAHIRHCDKAPLPEIVTLLVVHFVLSKDITTTFVKLPFFVTHLFT